MAEVIASSFIAFVCDQLTSKAISKYAELAGVDEDIVKLKRTLSIIQDVLEDAETRQGKEKTLTNWLRELKDLAYDADDVLDDLASKAAKKKLGTEARMKKKVRYYLPFLKKNKIALRVKEINKRLDEIAEQRSKFHLEKEVEAGGSSKIESSTIREKIGFDINDSEVYGRQEDKEKIVEFLLNTLIGGDIGVICIVGLGGLGKTTLAQLVYQDERVCQLFELKKSVVVSEESRIERVIGLIIEPGTGNNDAMQASLRQQFEKKRFLLVLDDVWSESQETWDKLRYLLRVGAKGSKIIVTTRSDRVASILGTIPPHRLSSLSLDDCWLLFERRAFPIGVERNPNLDSIGREIVKKCGGVPLAAKALGSLLRFKRSESVWQAIKDSEIWKLPESENCKILSVLKLSYDHLSPCLKQCFAYCSIFPKDYNINTNDLVKLWGAEGFLKPYDEHMHWEQIGLQYVDELLARSLFQNGWLRHVKMHDLVHDLARSVAGNECSIVGAATGECLSQNSRYASFNHNEDPSSAAFQSLRDAKKLRTLYLHGYPVIPYYEKKEERVQEVFHVISSNLNFLRALHLSGYPFKALPDSFKKLKHLRYLDLSHTPLQFFPPCINTLHNLQTLNLSFTDIKSIPDSISNLHSLCTLDLSSTKIESLPESICTLSNLYTLNLSFSTFIHELPQNMSNMKSLYTLNLSSTKIESLPESICTLSNLHTLNLFFCSSIHELPQNMSNMKSLCTLDLSYSGIESLPESICTLSNMHTLNLFQCSSIHELPQNMSTMKSLVHLDIRRCQELTCIPRGLGKLNQLRTLPIFIVGGETNCSLEELGSMKLEGRELEIRELQNVRNIDEAKGANLSDKHSIQLLKLSWERNSYKNPEQAHECDKDDEIVKIQHAEDVLQCLQPSKSLEALEINGYVGRTFPFWMMESFPSLQQLELRNLTGLEEWCSVGSEQLFPCLQTLALDNCPKLKALPSVFNAVPSLKFLYLFDLTGLEERCSVGSDQRFCLEGLVLNNCPKLKALPSVFNAFSSLKKLELINLTDLEEWCSVGSDQRFPCLEELILCNCPKLKALPSDLSSVNTVCIEGCDWLRVFNAFPSLKLLLLRDLTGLEELCSVGSEQLFPCLEVLTLDNCPKLKALPSNLSSVKLVRIRNCGCLSDKWCSDEEFLLKSHKAPMAEIRLFNHMMNCSICDSKL